MNLGFRRLTTFLLALLSGLLIIMFSNVVFSNENNPKPETRIGQMSEAVIQNRLQQLGYEKPTEIRLRSNGLRRIHVNGSLIPTTHYEVDTLKKGKLFRLRVDRLSGEIEEIPINN